MRNSGIVYCSLVAFGAIYASVAYSADDLTAKHEQMLYPVVRVTVGTSGGGE